MDYALAKPLGVLASRSKGMTGYRRNEFVVILLSGACAGLAACSAPQEQLTEVEKQTRLTESRIVSYTQGSLNWNQLEPSEQTLYRNIYDHKLSDREQSAWEKELREKGVAQSDGKLELRAPLVAEETPVATTVSPAGKTHGDLFAESAQHIKLVWNKQMPMSKLRPDEVVWYRAIYNRTLPAKQLKGWYAFLSAPAPHPSSGSGKMVELSLPH
jgi:hypothetical protein